MIWVCGLKPFLGANTPPLGVSFRVSGRGVEPLIGGMMDSKEWLEAGIDLEIAEDWFYKGFEEPGRAIPWINAGIDPNEAFLWILYNFQIEEALNWKSIGLGPDLSYSWKEVGFLPAEVSYFIYSGKSYMDIVEALRRGKSKDEIMRGIYNENI